jgi:biopolymer transport protein ExbB/TolQ
MVGTLVGFLIVLTTTFQNIDQTNAAEIKRIISELASGMGIALITSLTGLISSIIMKFELVMLESENEKI